MPKFTDALLGTLPSWLAWPVAALILLVLGWGKIRDFGSDIFPSQRLYAREKRKVELLKLIYEVEAIKKEHGLEDLTSRLPAHMQTEALVQRTEELSNSRRPDVLGWRRRFYFGCSGGIIVFILAIAFTNDTGVIFRDGAVFLGIALRGLLLSAMGGFFASFFRARTVGEAIMQGMLPALFVSLALANAPRPEATRLSGLSSMRAGMP
jgi:hypothetical protein